MFTVKKRSFTVECIHCVLQVIHVEHIINKYNFLYNDSILSRHDFAINENIIHTNGTFLGGSILPEYRYVIIEYTLTKR